MHFFLHSYTYLHDKLHSPPTLVVEDTDSSVVRLLSILPLMVEPRAISRPLPPPAPAVSLHESAMANNNTDNDNNKKGVKPLSAQVLLAAFV